MEFDNHLWAPWPCTNWPRNARRWDISPSLPVPGHLVQPLQLQGHSMYGHAYVHILYIVDPFGLQLMLHIKYHKIYYLGGILLLLFHTFLSHHHPWPLREFCQVEPSPKQNRLPSALKSRKCNLKHQESQPSVHIWLSFANWVGVPLSVSSKDNQFHMFASKRQELHLCNWDASFDLGNQGFGIDGEHWLHLKNSTWCGLLLQHASPVNTASRKITFDGYHHPSGT